MPLRATGVANGYEGLKMTNALTLSLMVLGWFAMALAMLWGMLRIARRHQRPMRRPVAEPRQAASRPLHGQVISLNA